MRWRLLSANNREIGRSATSFSDAEACRVAVKELQHSVEALEVVVRQTELRRWVWQLSGSDGVVACASHGYDRLVRCSRGLEQFRSELPAAAIGTGLMISYARRWGAI